jgi:hypothetical protein
MSCYRTIKNGKIHNVWIHREKEIKWNNILDDEDVCSLEIEERMGEKVVNFKRFK